LPAYSALETIGLDPRLREASTAIPQVGSSVMHFQIRASEHLAASGTASGIGDGVFAWTSAADTPRPGQRAVLEAWSEAFGSERLDAGGDSVGTRDAVALFPEIEGAIERVRRVSWARVPQIGGGGAYFAPGQVGRFLEALRAPASPIFFAGDHASDRPTWTVGAIRSAERAADQVLAHLGLR
jgi:monoamine oxidase